MLNNEDPFTFVSHIMNAGQTANKHSVTCIDIICVSVKLTKCRCLEKSKSAVKLLRYKKGCPVRAPGAVVFC